MTKTNSRYSVWHGDSDLGQSFDCKYEARFSSKAAAKVHGTSWVTDGRNRDTNVVARFSRTGPTGRVREVK